MLCLLTIIKTLYDAMAWSHQSKYNFITLNAYHFPYEAVKASVSQNLKSNGEDQDLVLGKSLCPSCQQEAMATPGDMWNTAVTSVCILSDDRQ